LANGMANTFVRPLDADPVFINSRFYFVFTTRSTPVPNLRPI
jgi:hypothetical protein